MIAQIGLIVKKNMVEKKVLVRTEQVKPKTQVHKKANLAAHHLSSF
jgi:hypothetical protein